MKAASPADVEGFWQGALVYHPRQVEANLTIDIAGSPPVGTVYARLLGLEFRPLENLRVDEREITFEVDSSGRSFSFRGKVSPDGQRISGKFKGQVADQDLELPFWLERTGEAGRDWSPPREQPLTTVTQEASELRTAFNRHDEKLRLVLLLSPQCKSCLGAASVVERYVLDAVTDECLQVYTVWGPMLGGETAEHAKAATAFLPDSRVTHFWTDGDRLAARFRQASGLPEGLSGWDTFLLYEPGAVWETTVPSPAELMHINQPLPESQALDAEKLADRIRDILREHPDC